MTTIVCDLVAMASDSKISIGFTAAKGNKLFRKDGVLIGTAGDCGVGEQFIRWYGMDGDRPTVGKKTEFEALVLTPTGIVYYGKDFEAVPLDNTFYAIGSGYMVALSEMARHGGTLHQAIEAACAVDDASGLPVQYLLLNPTKAKRANSAARH